MATSAVTFTQRERIDLGKVILIVGTIAVGAGDYTTGGLTAATITKYAGTTKSPYAVQMTGAGGYVYEWVRSSNKFQIRQGPTSAGILPELAATTTPAGVVADIIEVVAFVPKFG